MDEASERLLPLWVALFGEPPVVLIDAPTMIAILVDALPPPAFVPVSSAAVSL